MFILTLMTWNEFLNMVKTPPNGLWFILLVSVGISVLSTTLNKLLVDHEQLARMQETIAEHQKKKKELLKLAEKDPKRYEKEYIKWKRKDDSIQKMQQSMSMARLKPTCFTFIPLIIFFYVIRNLYTIPGGLQMVVAKPPMNAVEGLPSFFTNILKSEFYSAVGNIVVDEGWIGFSGYYILCSISMSMFMNRIAGISKTATGQGTGMSMFDTTAQQELPDPKTLFR